MASKVNDILTKLSNEPTTNNDNVRPRPALANAKGNPKHPVPIVQFNVTANADKPPYVVSPTGAGDRGGLVLAVVLLRIISFDKKVPWGRWR